jgi:hypothetical protein
MTKVKSLATAILSAIDFTGPHTNKFLSDFASGTFIYDFEALAKDECKRRTDCNGVTRQHSGTRYTLRKGLTLHESVSGEVSWQKTTFEVDQQILGSVRKVRVQLEGRNHLHMREVEVFDTSGVNRALNKPATQSSTYNGILGVLTLHQRQ